LIPHRISLNASGSINPITSPIRSTLGLTGPINRSIRRDPFSIGSSALRLLHRVINRNRALNQIAAVEI
jgi:hypothetical protein